MKKILIIALVVLLPLLGGCSNTEEDTVKIGISSSDTVVWDYVAQKAAKEGIDIEIVTFSDYVQPNLALAQGDIDANAFQTVSYFNTFIEDNNLDLVPLATTILAPMGIYSSKYDDVSKIPEGSQIAVPNDESNMNRALLLLQEAGLITLDPNYEGSDLTEAITNNPKNLEIVPMEAAQTPRALQDVAASVINNDVAIDAGYAPLDDSLYHEKETAVDYVNIIAVRAEDKDDPTLNRIAELYQEDDVAQLIDEEYNHSQIPTFLPLSDIGW